MANPWKRNEAIKQHRNNGVASMNVKFRTIFAGKASRTREEDHEATVHHHTVGFPKGPIIRLAGRRHLSTDHFGNEPAFRAGNTDHGNTCG
jgi:hypothetical protein